MPTEGECRLRAESDKKLADTLLAAANFNWAMTALFYSAVHHVNRLKVRDGCYADDGTHSKTLTYLDKSHPGARGAYVALMGKSRRARYQVGWVADLDSYERTLRSHAALVDYVDRAVAGQIPGI